MAEVAAVEIAASGPIVGVALHCAHHVREDVAACLCITEADRLREEDPYTELWTSACDVRLVALRSRFEVDLNRTRERAVYRAAADAWGLDVWGCEPDAVLTAESLRLYDAFYTGLRALLDDVAARFGRFVVLDLHSYNHRRDGPDTEAAEPYANPVLNLGTGSMDRRFWAPLVDAFTAALAASKLGGVALDVRENVRFKGGHLARWVHASYPKTGCAIALEWKKVFMDEWSGLADPQAIGEIQVAMKGGVRALREALSR